MNIIKHQHLGHKLLVIGAFTFLIGVTILSPLNNGVTKAFGSSDIINLTNKSRQQLNRSELKVNSDLMNAAQLKAEDMAKLHYFAHSAPDGTLAWDYLKKVGYYYEVAGENLAITNEDAEAVIAGWLNSPTHRDNLLSKNYNDFGIGMAYFGDYEGHKKTTVIVALYGRHSAAQDITATTIPAGTSTSLKPKFIDFSPTLVASLASGLMLAGVILEFRHIKHTHQKHQIS